MTLNNVKLFATVSFLFMIVSLASTAFAQVAYYGIDVILAEDGTSDVKLTITFREQVSTFNTTIIGRVSNFTATSNAGSVYCNVNVKGTTDIGCNLGLTKDQRTVIFSFKTPDFVKQLDDKFFFSNDFSIDGNNDRVFASIRLPAGMAIDPDIKLPFSDNVDILSEGNIIVWSLSNFENGGEIKLEALYERLPIPFFAQLGQLGIRNVAIIAIFIGGVLAFLFIRYVRQSEKLVLSVLDEFERKVVDIITANGGEVNQRKVVQETNLSKAKVSRVVKSLAERGLIEVQRLGRTNKLRLVKKKLGP